MQRHNDPSKEFWSHSWHHADMRQCYSIQYRKTSWQLLRFHLALWSSVMLWCSIVLVYIFKFVLLWNFLIFQEDQTVYFNITVNVTNTEVYDYNVTTEIEKYGCAVYGVGANGSLVYLEPYTPRPTAPATTAFTDATEAFSTDAFAASTTGGEVTFGAMTTESAPLYLNTTVQCGNATVELVETLTANNTFLVLSWKLEPQERSCEDYKIRLKCPKGKRWLEPRRKYHSITLFSRVGGWFGCWVWGVL